MNAMPATKCSAGILLVLLAVGPMASLWAQVGGPSAGDADSRALGPAIPGMRNPHVSGEVPLVSPGEEGAVRPLPSGRGLLVGHLIHPHPQDAHVKGLDVRLFAFGEGKQRAQWSGRTDADGRFRFEHLNTEPNTRYIASVLYQGVVYLSESTTFPKDAAASERPTLDLPVTVYPSGPAPGHLSLDSMHFIVEQEPTRGALRITEVLAFLNPDERTLIGDEDGTITLSLDLPSGADDIQIHEGFVPAQVGLSDDALVYTGPIYPGTTQVVFSYAVRPQASWAFRRRLAFPAKMVEIFVPKGGPAILSPQFEQVEPLAIQGRTFEHYRAGSVPAGGGIRFQIGGVSGGHAVGKVGTLAANAIAAGIGIVLLVYVFFPFVRRRTHAVSVSHSAEEIERMRWTHIRDRMLEAVREIDFDYECGKLSESDHARLRAEYKARAVDALAALEALDASSSAKEVPEQGDDSLPSSKVLPFCTACGQRAEDGDRFCARCGAGLRAESA